MAKQTRKKETVSLCTLCVLPFREHPTLLSTALYNKYTAMTEYRSYQELNAIINDERSRLADAIKDLLAFDNTQECLKRYHMTVNGRAKQTGLLKYYKYHVSVPQCHLTGVDQIIQKWQHLQLRIYYKSIKKQLNMQVSRTESSTEKEQSESVTTNEQHCTCFLCELQQPSSATEQVNLVGRTRKKVMAKSESKALYEMLRVLGSPPSEDSQNYLKEEFTRDWQDSKREEHFEKYIEDYYSNESKRNSDQAAIKISPKEKGAFLKKHISEFKSVGQMVKESQFQHQPKPKLSFKKRPARQDNSPEWSPIYNFINNFLNDTKSPQHKNSPNSNARKIRAEYNTQTQESQFRSTKLPLHLPKNQTLSSYQTAMPKIQFRQTAIYQEKHQVDTNKESGPAILQTAIRHQSLTSHRGSGPTTADKVKTQTRVSKPKTLSLERIKTVMPISVRPTNAGGNSQKSGIRARFLGKSPLSQQFLTTGKMLKRTRLQGQRSDK